MKSLSAPSKRKDAIILGGGSVGLSLALMLLKQGLQISLIDRRPPQSWAAPAEFDSRVYALNPQSCALLDTLGAWKYLDTSRIGIIKEMEVLGDAQGRLRFGDRSGYLAQVVEDGAIQSALRSVLHDLYGSAWFQVDEAHSLHLNPCDISIELNASPMLKASLLVGADGTNSWLRKTLKWESKRHEYKQQGVVINLSCSEPHNEIARQWFLDGEVIALLPLGGHHISLVWSAHQDQAQQLLALDSAALVNALRDKIGEPLGPLRALSQAQSFPLELVKVPKIAGERCALIGDAAHGVHPLAGQGLNLGFADAACLAQTIEERGAGPDVGDQSLLRRYARRRALPISLMQGVTDGLHQLFSQNTFIHRPLRNIGMNLVNTVPYLKSLIVSNAAGSPPR
jgi:2-octaprenyl-6-methoxyphenol hydroxylase